ncbi:MAG: hypothetical protein IKU43_05110, partial [Clostridia bacterium]|nr:hypothetical protein [Clostridia bacterium]
DVYVLPYGETEKTVFSEGNTDTYGTQIVPFVDGSDRLYAERIGAKAFSKLGISSDYKVASANYYGKTTNTGGIAGLSGTSEFTLEEDKEYVVLFNAKQTGVMHIANLTLEYEKPSELTRIEADFGKVAVGSKLSPKVTWYSGSKKIDGEAGSVATEIVEDSDNILLKTSGGDIIAVADGTAKIKVTGTLNGKSRSVEVTLVITHPNARVEEATTAKVYITATSGAVLENVSGAVVGSQIDAAVNTTVSVTAPKTTPDGKVFKYWKNLSSDSVYSTSESISFKVASNISLMAVYAEKENGYLVEFANANRNIVSSKYLNSGDAIIAPALPYLTGYGVATSWSSYPEIVGTSDVQSIAEYGAPESVAVTVIGGTSDKTEYSYNDKVTVTANAAPSGRVFSHWTRDGQVVSYNSVYSFYAWDDATITANYAASAPSAFPSVIIDVSVRNDGGANAYMMELVGFEGKQILERGILFGGSGLSLSGGTVYKAVSVLGATQFSAMTPDTSFDVSAVRAYVVYNDNGIIRIAYSAER